jgi:hypothetical protein
MSVPRFKCVADVIVLLITVVPNQDLEHFARPRRLRFHMGPEADPRMLALRRRLKPSLHTPQQRTRRAQGEMCPCR